MKQKEHATYSCRVTIRYTSTELEQVTSLQQASTCKNLSTYIRKVSLQKPVIVKYRNASADDFIADMILLKNELNAIGNNFNQAVKKLHTMDHVLEVKTWAILNESSKRILDKKVEEILEKVSEIYELWLQK